VHRSQGFFEGERKKRKKLKNLVVYKAPAQKWGVTARGSLSKKNPRAIVCGKDKNPGVVLV